MKNTNATAIRPIETAAFECAALFSPGDRIRVVEVTQGAALVSLGSVKFEGRWRPGCKWVPLADVSLDPDAVVTTVRLP